MIPRVLGDRGLWIACPVQVWLGCYWRTECERLCWQMGRRGLGDHWQVRGSRLLQQYPVYTNTPLWKHSGQNRVVSKCKQILCTILSVTATSGNIIVWHAAWWCEAHALVDQIWQATNACFQCEWQGQKWADGELNACRYRIRMLHEFVINECSHQILNLCELGRWPHYTCLCMSVEVQLYVVACKGGVP